MSPSPHRVPRKAHIDRCPYCDAQGFVTEEPEFYCDFCHYGLQPDHPTEHKETQDAADE